MLQKSFQSDFKSHLWLRKLQVGLLILLVIIPLGIRLPGLFARSIHGDEAISLLETAGHATPSWPQQPTVVSTVQEQFFKGNPSFNKITEDLHRTDVHPPVYFWILSLWRRWLGFSLETARTFSLICSIGTVIVLYLLLRTSAVRYPIIPTLVYALSSSGVHFAQETRPYALSSLLVMAGVFFAYLASKHHQERLKCVAYSLAMAISCGLAFESNYLSAFPVFVIFIWFEFNLWRASRFVVVLAPLVTSLIVLAGLPILSVQLGARPDQASGFIGFLPEVKKLLLMNFGNIYFPTVTTNQLLVKSLLLSAILIITMLLVITCIRVLTCPTRVPQSLLMLLLGLALAPSAGIFLLDLLSDKNLSSSRYVMLAGPALTVLIGYGVSTFNLSKKHWGKLVILALIVLQITGINWGYENTPGQKGSYVRSLAHYISASSSPSNIVVMRLGPDQARGGPGALVYELDSKTKLASIPQNTTFDNLQKITNDYSEFWLVLFYAPDEVSNNVEATLLNAIKKSGNYISLPVLDDREYYHYRSIVHHYQNIKP